MLDLRRRQFLTLLGGAAVAWPLAARGQQPTVALVGLLTGSKQDDRWLGALRQGLKEAGYIEGRRLRSNTVRPMVTSTECRHWQPSWSLTLWP
jgi:hypothetical protein